MTPDQRPERLVPPARPPRPAPARFPNFKVLLVTGALIGFAAGVIFSAVGDPAQGYSATTAALYLGVLGAAAGTALAGLLGVLLDRSGRDGS